MARIWTLRRHCKLAAVLGRPANASVEIVGRGFILRFSEYYRVGEGGMKERRRFCEVTRVGDVCTGDVEKPMNPVRRGSRCHHTSRQR
jgi:hypothetical protein